MAQGDSITPDLAVTLLDKEAWIEGRPEKLIALADSLSTVSRVELQETPPSRFGRVATAIVVHRESAPGVAVSEAGGELVFTGADAGLELLLGNIRSLGEDPDRLGGHIHLDYFPDHFYLRPESLPLMVGCRR